MSRAIRSSIVLFGAAALLAACGNQATSSLIVAAEGGSVALESHSITIPPASLAADTEVVLQTGDIADYPALEGARSDVIELLPEGTVLETPATVTLGADLVALADGESVSVHQFVTVDGERWVPLESSLRSGGSLEVSVTRLAPLAVVVRSAPSTGNIMGTLTWASDSSPVSGATLELWQGETMIDSATTGAAGDYAFSEVEPGDYTVLGNPECAVNESVTVSGGMTATVDISICG